MKKSAQTDSHYPIVRPSDAVSWVSCVRRVWLDNNLSEGPEDELAGFDQLVAQLGEIHEQSILAELTTRHQVETAQSVEHTQALMNQGVEVIYQAQLFDGEQALIGYPDFLIRQDDGKYQAADAKLSLNEQKKEIQTQLGCYRKLLDNGLPALVYLGDGSQAAIGDESEKLADKFLDDMRQLLASDNEPDVRYSHSKCKICPYYGHCKPQFVANEDLSLLYGVQGRAAEGLEKVGIVSISSLANTNAEDIPDVPYLKGVEKKQRAVLQAKAWQTGEYYQLHPIELPTGTWIHFDIEDNPLTSTGEKHVYLWGFLLPGSLQKSGNEQYEYIWTDSDDQDHAGWLAFLDKVAEYKNQYPDLILAHYAIHERTTIKQYAERYRMENHSIVEWLLGDNSPLFDIQKPVTENLVLPLQGYGLKDICKHRDLVNFQWEDDESGSQWSIVQFNRFLEITGTEEKASLKQEILGYNRDDVIATRRLEEWLRNL